MKGKKRIHSLKNRGEHGFYKNQKSGGKSSNLDNIGRAEFCKDRVTSEKRKDLIVRNWP